MLARKFFVASLFLALLVWVGITYFYARGRRKSEPSRSVPSADQESSEFFSGTPVESWPKYQNQTFGYQLHYPPELTPRDQGQSSQGFLNLTNFVLVEEDGQVYPIVGVKIISASYQQTGSGLGPVSESDYNLEGVVVGGVRGVRVSGLVSDDGGQIEEVILPLSDGKKTLRIICTTLARQRNYRRLFEQVLDSFSFL